MIQCECGYDFAAPGDFQGNVHEANRATQDTAEGSFDNSEVGGNGGYFIKSKQKVGIGGEHRGLINEDT